MSEYDGIPEYKYHFTMDRKFNTIKKPVKWFWKEKKKYSAHKTFGVAIEPIPDFGFDFPLSILDSYNQFGTEHCSANGSCIGEYVESQITYDADQYWKDEMAMLGVPDASGVDIETVAAIGCNPGFQVRNSTERRKRGAYYWVHPNNGMDWFDSIVNVSYQRFKAGKNTVIRLGTDWYDDWENTNSGIVPATYNNKLGGHFIIIFGKKTIAGEPRLVNFNSWGVAAPGSDQGKYYFSRDEVNKKFGEYGVYFYEDSKDPNTQRQGLLQALLVNLKDLLTRLVISTGKAFGFKG